MHIYDKQCEIMQKNQWKSQTFQILCFLGVFSTELLTSHCKNTESESLDPSIDFFA